MRSFLAGASLFVALIGMARSGIGLAAWGYSESVDSMGRGTVKIATVESANLVEFRFPYGGAQRAELDLIVRPWLGKDVLLSLKNAHFLCQMDGCNVTVRFDNGKAERFSASGPSDHSTTAIFIRGYDRFVRQLARAKVLRIEAQFYQDGSRVFEFDVSGLKWDDAQPRKPGGPSGTRAPRDAAMPAMGGKCLACHAVEKSIVGPGFRNIARRYRGIADAAHVLARSIKEGSGRKWGEIPMPPEREMSEEDALSLARWIVSLQ